MWVLQHHAAYLCVVVECIRRLIRVVSGALPVCFCRSAGLAEELDQVLALGELLLFQTEDRADAFEGERQAHRGRSDHGAAPAFRIEVSGTFCGEWMIIMEGIEADAQIL